MRSLILVDRVVANNEYERQQGRRIRQFIPVKIAVWILLAEFARGVVGVVSRTRQAWLDQAAMGDLRDVGP